MHSDSPISSILPHSSTPYRQSSTTSSSTDAYRSLATSSEYFFDTLKIILSEYFDLVKGTEVNKSYLEANKTDLSLNDISTWLHTRNMIDSSRNKRVRKSYALRSKRCFFYVVNTFLGISANCTRTGHIWRHGNVKF